MDPDDIAGSLERVRAALPATLDGDTVAWLVREARPRWGVRSAEDARSYVAFWSELSAQHVHPQLRGAYSDVLLLLGGPERTCEAVRVFVEAANADPTVFDAYSSNFSEAAVGCGPELACEYELAQLGFFAWLVDRGEMDADDLQDSVRELMQRFGTQFPLRERLLAIARRSTG